MRQKILIVDLGSQYTQIIARRTRELGVYCEVVDVEHAAEQYNHAKGIIISGSPDSIDEEAGIDTRLLAGTTPLLGICFGLQLLCSQFGGQVQRHPVGGEYGPAVIRVLRPSNLFKGIKPSFRAWMSHKDTAANLGDELEVIAESTNGLIAALEMPGRNLFAVQFHPEVAHTEQGSDLLRNFLFDICGCNADWSTSNIVEEKQRKLTASLGQDRVLLGLSGGVDSAVVAALLQSVIGANLKAVFVDTGLLRAGEAEQVRRTFSEFFPIDLEVIDARQKFFAALKGVTDPEKKRKIIGRLFIEEFEQAAIRYQDCRWLAQGTIYPDIIESADPKVSKKSKVIKSHHNVGGLPAHMKLQLIEPLRNLFKDEVRRLGEALGLPRAMVWRHPFPGPGLAVRVLGEVKPEYVEILRQADAIYMRMLEEAGEYHRVSQAFAVFIPIKTVGVKGDDRVYEYLLALRAVQTDDFMTATAAPLDHDLLHRIATSIVNSVDGITRVCYDISPKPPATVEWE